MQKFLPPQAEIPSPSPCLSQLSGHLLSQARPLDSFSSKLSSLLNSSSPLALSDRFLVVDKVLTLCDDDAFDGERTLPLRTAFRDEKRRLVGDGGVSVVLKRGVVLLVVVPLRTTFESPVPL